MTPSDRARKILDKHRHSQAPGDWMFNKLQLEIEEAITSAVQKERDAITLMLRQLRAFPNLSQRATVLYLADLIEERK